MKKGLHRLRGAGSAGWLAAAVVTALALTFVPAWSAPNLVSNVDGKIRVIILHYGSGEYLGFWYDQTVLYGELLAKMDKDVGFIILMGKDDQARKARESLKPLAEEKLADGTNRVKFLDVDVKTSMFYPWARDGYVVLSSPPDKLVFLDCGFYEKPFPVLTWDKLIEGAESWAGIVHRGGGNIRTTDEDVFIGMDTLLGIKTQTRWVEYQSRSYDTLYEMAKDIKPADVTVFKDKFEAHARLVRQILAPDKKLVVPEQDLFFEQLKKGKFLFSSKKQVRHTGAQAAYHTDVYLGAGDKDKDGKRTLFLADSGLAAKIVGKMSADARRAVERELPRVLAEEGFLAAGIPVTEAQIAERMAWDKHKLLDLGLARAKKLADRFDTAAGYLAKLGYRIVRIPFLPNGLTDEAEANNATMGIGFNYSNVLVEVYGDVKRVYMPRFGFKELDDAAEAAYASAGFQVVPLKGLLTNSLSQEDANAGLDCLTSEIRFPVRWAPEKKK
jgi:hypothetical protein